MTNYMLVAIVSNDIRGDRTKFSTAIDRELLASLQNISSDLCPVVSVVGWNRVSSTVKVLDLKFAIGWKGKSLDNQ